MAMVLTVFGTRGSIPAPGPDTNRYGGNTSCVCVENGTGHVVVLDAGSGIRLAGQHLPPETRRIDILLTHLHMDHIQGLGFFGPLYKPGLEVHIWGPPSTTRTLRKRLARYLSPPLFPVRLRDLPSSVRCHDVRNGGWEFEDYKVEASLVCHPDPTVGYRLTHKGRALAYLPDHEPQLGRRDHRLPQAEWLSGFRVAEGADLLLHDAQYTEEEYRTRVGWGHCTPELAVRFAETVDAHKLLFFHHDPARGDEQLEQVCEAAADTHKGKIDIGPAAEMDRYVV
ncbi:MAG: MBL fold metallo-hydrolase [Alphaproteobacteria bacterium]|nr:MBL fold metallo-hydrolase [Alphaproteobacteria bacterium]MCB9795660.1 MBL fold metallo-hydrolase [Alphaproteobacteria bacterium]